MRRIRCSIAVILLAGFGFLFCGEQLLSLSLTSLKTAQESEVARQVKRLERPRRKVPAQATVGYLSDQPDNLRYYYLTQYALAPVVVLQTPEVELVVGNFLTTDTQTVLRQYPQFSLYEDFGDGVLLLSRRVKTSLDPPQGGEISWVRESAEVTSRPLSTVMWGVWSILFVGLSGVLLVYRFCRAARWTFMHFLLLGSLALGLGWGLSSLLYFLCLSLWGTFHYGLMLVETFLLAALFFLGRKKKPLVAFALNDGIRVRNRRDLATGLMGVLVLFGLLSIGFLFIKQSILNPHGEWDAWAIWNLHARFLFRGNEHWTALFTPGIGWTHQSYPLLLPGAIARCWSYLGKETLWIPGLVGGCFTFATVGLLLGGVHQLRGPLSGYLAAVVLMGTPLFYALGADQMADVPVGYFFLATLLLLVLHDYGAEPQDGYLVVAGLMAGCAAWTKDEGLVFVFVVLTVRGTFAVRQRGWRAGWQDCRPFLTGAVPILIVLAYFKLVYAPSDVLITGLEGISRKDQILDMGRYG
ncbi:MAG: glycosyltransferase family 39 protein [Deltaproteobacteria bacterium]|nr:glycosyltransferase family 39 protein [Deltaproteobacteria bacterium]